MDKKKEAKRNNFINMKAIFLKLIFFLDNVICVKFNERTMYHI